MPTIPVYDPVSGTVTMQDEASTPTPTAGDSGVDYSQSIFDLLKFGIGKYAENDRARIFSNTTPYVQGRQGLTPVGQPTSVFTSPGSGMNAQVMIILGVALVGVLLLVRR